MTPFEAFMGMQEPSGKKNRPGTVPQEGPGGREVRSGQGWDVLKEDFAGLQGKTYCPFGLMPPWSFPCPSTLPLEPSRRSLQCLWLLKLM